MRWLLDTNTVSYWMRGDAGILAKLAATRPCDLAIAAITCAEIRYGIGKSPHRKKERSDRLAAILEHVKVLPFDIDATPHYADIRVRLEKDGVPISERDLQIAAIARANGLAVVTHNGREFGRVPDLAVEDWYDGPR